MSVCGRCGTDHVVHCTDEETLRQQVRDRDELLEAAQREIERLREESRAAAAREIRDRDEILAVRDDALRRLRVAVDALMAIGEPIDGITSDDEWVTAEALAALAKIRGCA